MDCKDLMVGDLVYIHEPKCKGHRVDYINELDGQVGADGEVYDECDIRPIPLTEEILVKNGFVQNAQCCSIVGEQQAVGCGTDFYYIDVFNCRTVSIKCVKGLLGLEIHYVHQLQHLLRLCGVEKELVID